MARISLVLPPAQAATETSAAAVLVRSEATKAFTVAAAWSSMPSALLSAVAACRNIAVDLRNESCVSSAIEDYACPHPPTQRNAPPPCIHEPASCFAHSGEPSVSETQLCPALRPYALRPAQLGGCCSASSAAVVLKEGMTADEKDIRTFTALHLADFKVPRKVLILDEIPKGATGKLQRIGLAEKLGLAG